MNRKILRRLLAVTMAAGTFTFAPNFYQLPTFQIVQAEIKMYSGTGEDYPSQIENLEVSRLRAVDKAVKSAVEKAGVALSAYSRAKNFNLTENEITAITSNTYQIVGEPKCEKIVHQITDVSAVVIWRVTVNVNVDDAEILKWMRLDTKENAKIVNQTQENIKAAAENETKVEDLRKRLANETDKDKLKAEFEQADAEFLSNQKLAEGTKLYYRQKYSEAVAAFEDALKYNPNNADAWQTLGEIYTTFLTDTDKAFDCYNKAIEIDPENLKAWAGLGLIHFTLNDKTKCAESYNRAAQIGEKILAQNPNDVKTLINLGQIYSEMAMFKISGGKNAVDYFQKAAAIEPTNKEIWIRLGASYIYPAGNHKKVIECYKKILEFAPNDIYALNSIGLHYALFINDYDMAFEYCNRALQIDGEFANAYTSRGHIYKAMKNFEKAIENFKKAVELAPETSYNWRNLADVYKEMKNYSQAVQCYEQALKIAPKDPFMWSQLAYLYHHEIKDNYKAIECYTRALEFSPNDKNYYEMRAYCYDAIGDKAKAKADREKAKTLK